ncbi:hypothetical protein [Nannocystis sp. SCPEA4]|uniref:hypothetical protein n=1 Tax=Nannocystis sp. SCPEA4 TaxID=2996787 RepID=UPI00226E6B12|nr:hypothetical protein [Nannocystis sp. SCPEA4]MCY1056788.1 hypothetical protein [Nannocystis sp. SCPEA4]
MVLPDGACKALAVARGLRYGTLAGLPGRRVCLFALHRVIANVLTELAPALPPGIEPAAANFPDRAVAKYGIVHITVPIGGAVELPRPSRRDLRALGVLVRSGHPEQREVAADFFDTLLEEIAADVRVLNLILDVEHDHRTHDERVAHTYKGLPQSYFPRMARVRDAAVTNAPASWMYKHLYL